MGIVNTTVVHGGRLVTTPSLARYVPLAVVNTPVHTPTVVLTDGSSSSTPENVKSMDMSIYRILSMQSDMKTLVRPTVLKNEFDQFIQYAEELTAGNLSDSNFLNLNQYLGSLGV